MIINPTPSVESVGGKGYQLSILKKICTVPEFFLLSFENSEEINLDDVQNQIMDYFDSFPYGRVAVRSSATMEDSSIGSFAGMFESVLNVERKDLISAIRKVLKSIEDIRVKEYCRFHGLDYSAIRMCVIIQRMIDSRVSGVCITKENKGGDTIVLEACYGLGEALVSGLITPDTYRVNRNNLEIVSRNIGFQKYMFNRNTHEKPVSVPFHMRNAKKLKDSEISEITGVALKIESKLNYYSADIEWAYEGKNLFLLQVRPFIAL